MLLAAGLIDLGFALFHATFWRLLDWPGRLAPSGGHNAAITQTLNIMLTFVFAAYGGAVLWQGAQGQAPTLLPAIGAAFWLLRLVLQFVLFDFRPFVSKVITAAFALAAVLHLLAALA